MNKNHIITTVLLASLLVTGNDYINNAEAVEEVKSTSKSKRELVLEDNSYTETCVISSDGEKVTVEQEYDKYTICKGTKIYATDNNKEIVIDESMLVSLLEVNGNMALIMFDNGIYAYTNVHSLIKCVDVFESEYKYLNENNMVILSDIAKVYDNNGMYIKSMEANTLCYVVSINDKYAYVTFEDGTYAYVEISHLLLLTSKVEGYGYVRNNTYIYDDKEMSNVKGNVNAREIVYILFANDNYAYVKRNNGECSYMNISDLDKDFIIINLDEQRMYCFLDFQVANSYGVRSGRDSSPTHEGDFDIDWKTENWEFTTFPGSYAKHWIPINEFAEGIHDLVGDDEANYGNDLYHSYGSHGCIRVPAAASQFVYDNYDVGDMVLVRRR